MKHFIIPSWKFEIVKEALGELKTEDNKEIVKRVFRLLEGLRCTSDDALINANQNLESQIMQMAKNCDDRDKIIQDLESKLNYKNISQFCECGTPPNELDVNGNCDICGNKLKP
jgi:hypothetical protein